MRTMNVLFLGKRNFNSKDGTPLVEMTFLDLTENKLVRQTADQTRFDEFGLLEPNAVDVVAIKLEDKGFGVSVVGSEVVGTVDMVVKALPKQK